MTRQDTTTRYPPLLGNPVRLIARGWAGWCCYDWDIRSHYGYLGVGRALSKGIPRLMRRRVMMDVQSTASQTRGGFPVGSPLLAMASKDLLGVSLLRLPSFYTETALHEPPAHLVRYVLM